MVDIWPIFDDIWGIFDIIWVISDDILMLEVGDRWLEVRLWELEFWIIDLYL